MSAPTSAPSGNAIQSSKGASRSLSASRKTSMPIPIVPVDKTNMPSKSTPPTLLTTPKADTPTIAEKNNTPSLPSVSSSEKRKLVPSTTTSSLAMPVAKQEAENPKQPEPIETQPTTAMSELEMDAESSQIETQLRRKSLQPWGLPPEDILEVISLSQPNLSPIKSSQPLLYYQFNTTNRRLQMLPAVVNTFPHSQQRRHRQSGCFVWALATLALLLIGLTISWFAVIRPSIHNLAETELDASLSRAEENIPPPLPLLPGMIIPIQEHTLTEILVLNLESSSPIENPATHITPSNVRLDFQLYGFPCSISVVPKIDNGHFVVSDVNIEGIIGFVMSPDDITKLLDTHLTHAQELFQHSVTNVQLKDQEMDLTLT
jgi:hypothetical protein